MTLNLPEKSRKKSGDGDTLKRRLLGAAVLIALAVIFLPLVLDGSGSESRFRRVEQLRMQPPRIIGADGELESRAKVPQPVAAAPQGSVVPSEQPTTGSSTSANPANPAMEPKPTAAELQSTPSEASAEQPAAKARRQPASRASTDVRELVAWIIQAGSFSDELNALALRNKLRKQGFPTFVTLADNGQTVLYRVKVGPMTDLAKAESSQSQIEKIIGRETLVRRYP